MDKKFLNKVVGQIVRETMVDYDKERLYTPFFHHISFYLFLFYFHITFSHYFSHHCEEVYGLNRKEMYYVWEEYKHIIIDKINNG